MGKLNTAAQAFDASNSEAKSDRILAILEKASQDLEAEGVKYFLGVVDRQPNDPKGGKAYAQSDITGEEFPYILDMAMPKHQDIVNLGIWVGQLLTARNKKK